MKLSDLKYNPQNPQSFTDLSKLRKSTEMFPKMMELRPLVYDPETMFVLGGNKRLLCLNEMKMLDIPDDWAKSAEGLTEEEKQHFILADNMSWGTWDWEAVEANWDTDFLGEIGLTKFDAFQPSLEPTFGGREITQDEIDKANNKLELNSEGQELVKIMCHCMEEFKIAK